jgi:hypothetical protein
LVVGLNFELAMSVNRRDYIRRIMQRIMQSSFGSFEECSPGGSSRWY